MTFENLVKQELSTYGYYFDKINSKPGKQICFTSLKVFDGQIFNTWQDAYRFLMKLRIADMHK